VPQHAPSRSQPRNVGGLFGNGGGELNCVSDIMFFLDFGFFASGGRGGYKAGERKAIQDVEVVVMNESERRSL